MILKIYYNHVEVGEYDLLYTKSLTLFYTPRGSITMHRLWKVILQNIILAENPVFCIPSYNFVVNQGKVK